MLEVQVTGDEHPKTFTIVSDDDDAENARFGDLLKSAFGDDDDLAQEWHNKETDSDGSLRMIVPTESAELVGEMLLEESDWPDEGQKILDTIQAARESFEEKVADQEGSQ